MKNLADLKTTLPTLIGFALTLLGAFGLIEVDSIPALSEALVGLGISIMTIVGLYAKS